MTLDYDNLTLPQILGVVLRDDIRLPHSQTIAQIFYEKTVEKFLACTERERRDITRSDPEFMAIIRDAIIQRCGFKNEQEAYEKEIEIPKIPRIKRGNEYIWSPLGDPQKPEAQEMQEINKKLDCLTTFVLKKFREFYPHDYAKSFSDSKLLMLY